MTKEEAISYVKVIMTGASSVFDGRVTSTFDGTVIPTSLDNFRWLMKELVKILEEEPSRPTTDCDNCKCEDAFMRGHNIGLENGYKQGYRDAKAEQKSCETTTNNDEPIYINYPIITCDDIAEERYKDLCEYFGETKDILKSRKEFKAWLERVKWHIHKAEELYEKYEYKQDKQEPCDTISREAALKECHDIVVDGDRYRVVQEETLVALPSVTPSRPCDSCRHWEDRCTWLPSRRKGHWIKEDTDWLFFKTRDYRCSECGNTLDFDGVNVGRGDANFCPNCGADMRGDTE